MDSYIARPYRPEVDLDPHEQLAKVLANPIFQPHISISSEMPDLLTRDIEQKLASQGKLAWFDENWMDGVKEQANKIIDILNLDKEKYVFWIGHHSWINEIFAVPAELRIKGSISLVQVSSSCFSNKLSEIIKHLYESAETGATVKRYEGSEENKVMFLPDRAGCLGQGSNGRRAQLMAQCSIADERFIKLLTILRIWKEQEFNKIDTKGAFSLYAFALMLIHFLQVGCQPPVLPPVSDLGVELDADDDSEYIVRNSNIKFKSKNKKSLGNLLFNFFNYYETTRSGGFDFVNWKISLREGKAIRLDKPSKTLFIEDPISVKLENVIDESKSQDLSNTLAVMFMRCRARLMKDRRLHQIENFI